MISSEGIKERIRGYRHELAPRMIYSFSRPLVMFHSDDWGLLGIKDKERFDSITGMSSVNDTTGHLSGYGFETQEDLHALFEVLEKHVDSSGSHPSIVCNFILANIDFQHVIREGFRSLALKPIKEGFPTPWSSSDGIINDYMDGISRSLIYPSMHGICHFCFKAIEAVMQEDSARGESQRALLLSGTPFSYAETPWAGFEFKDEAAVTGTQWLSPSEQRSFIHQGVNHFRELFGSSPLSACAPGYRANSYTYEIWGKEGIRVVHLGPYHAAGPVKGPHGLFYIQRNVEFEPAVSPEHYSPGRVLEGASDAIERGFPAVISIHSVNFHSSIKNYRDVTINGLDSILDKLKKMYPDLLYVNDKELLDIILNGKLHRKGGTISINIERRLSLSYHVQEMIKGYRGEEK